MVPDTGNKKGRNMSYKIFTHFYSKKFGLCTETEQHKISGNGDFTLDTVKDILDQWSFNGVISNSVIRYDNGDERYFRIEYNGVWCKKYSNGIK